MISLNCARMAATAALACGTYSCAGHTLYVETSRFTAEQQALIQYEVDQWAEVTDGRVGIDLVWADHYERAGRDWLHATTSAELTKRLDRPEGACGVTWAARGLDPADVWVATDADEVGCKFGLTVLHELGHYLGAHHIEQGAGVMQPSEEWPTRVTCADVTEVCRGFGCDAKDMRLCK